MKIDVIRTSASRPEFLIESTKTLIENLKFSGELRFIIHEDVFNEKPSEECIRYIESVEGYEIIKDSPPIGQGLSLNRLFKMVESEFFISWEDDYTCTRELNLDIPYKILNENNDINQIVFNKRDTLPSLGEPPKPIFYKKVIGKSGYKLTSSPHWRLTPAMWRKSFIEKFWFKSNAIDFNWKINDKIRSVAGSFSGEFREADWVMKNIGSYYLGGIDEKKYCFHIGGGKSLREHSYEWK